MFGGWDTPVCYNDMYMLDLGEQHTHTKYLNQGKRATTHPCLHY